MILVTVEATQIQPYLFGSNRLRENIGASHLVRLATTGWVGAALREAVPGRLNLLGNDSFKPVEDIQCFAAVVVQLAGGMAAVLFHNDEHRRAFEQSLSRRVLTRAPGLQLCFARRAFDWEREAVAAVLADCREEAERRKREQVPAVPQLGLSVTRVCRSTGLPAWAVTFPIEDDEESVFPASPEIHAKRDATRAAHEHLKKLFPIAREYDYPKDLDYLGRSSGEYSHVAVVHADGNSIGDRFKQLGARHTEAGKANLAFLKELHALSEALAEAGREALGAALGTLVSMIHDVDDEKRLRYFANSDDEDPLVEIPLRRFRKKNRELGAWQLPVRPLVFGGDDVTLVCDGRLGVSLALRYLHEFEVRTQHLPDGLGRATSAAGVSIVKSHYPFSRAAELAYELAETAKELRRSVRRQRGDVDSSALDWHFALSGLSGGLAEIREREYRVPAGALALRPLLVDANVAAPAPGWPVVRSGLVEFQGDGWRGRRNKLKALREALRGGPDQVRWFLRRFNDGNDLPEVFRVYGGWRGTGWHGEVCGYFDALELADWYVPL